MKELICIVCPKGCHLTVDEAHGFAVSGASCKRGESYGKSELTDPRRVLTSTVLLAGGALPRLPVKTDRPIPKGDLARAMEAVNTLRPQAPVEAGQVLLDNLFGARLVATRAVEQSPFDGPHT